MEYNEQKGDLFELSEKYSLAYCISLDCEMGAGIAVEFNKKFKGMKKELNYVVNVNNLHYPFTILFDDKYRKVFNLITKNKYWNKPTYESITECIKQMMTLCERYEIKYLAMPKIGCGLDRLQWGKVREIIKDVFKDMDIKIEVRYL